MAIVRCGECHNLMSTLDATCPHCGASRPSAVDAVLAGQARTAGSRSSVRTIWSQIRSSVYASIGTAALIVVGYLLHQALAQPKAASVQLDYVWWPGDRVESVVLYGNQHQDVAPDLQTLHKWEDLGDVCLANAGTAVEVTSNDQLSFSKVSIMAMAGDCVGFRGWVPATTLHDVPP